MDEAKARATVGAKAVRPSVCENCDYQWCVYIRSLESLLQQAVDVLDTFTEVSPAFRTKPIGALGSDARDQQEAHIQVEDRARAVLTAAAEVNILPGKES